MRLLLDTHALLWWWADEPQLSAAARAAIADRGNEVLVSAASAWEIATKQRLGKLSALPGGAQAFADLTRADGLVLLPIAAEHAWLAGHLQVSNRDPFDRMLAAQSALEKLPLVTRDPAFAAFNTATLW